MASSPFSSPVLASDTTLASEEHAQALLNLGCLQPIFVLPTHFTGQELHLLEDRLLSMEAPLTYDISEARIIISKVEKRRRLEMELRSRQLYTIDIHPQPRVRNEPNESHEPPRKKARITCESPVTSSHAFTAADLSSSLGTEGQVSEIAQSHNTQDYNRSAQSESNDTESIQVVRPKWLEDSVRFDKILPLHQYLIYQGRIVHQAPGRPSSIAPTSNHMPVVKSSLVTRQAYAEAPLKSSGILERAMADTTASTPRRDLGFNKVGDTPQQRFRERGYASQSQPGAGIVKPLNKLLQETTSEYEEGDNDIPEPPEWVKQHAIYACQRATFVNPPNEIFIKELKKIRLVRVLIGDEIGVRAYSTSIAALAAYPYPISHPKEVVQLPGCDVKIANLWVEWKNNDGVISIVREAEEDEDMKVLRLFHDIWGVGPNTAREFYFKKGWRDLDDIIEFGWNSLSRVQQIGVKFYDEFLAKIPQAEVKSITSTIHRHAVKVRDECIEVVTVGGYRRGKEESGDVDVIVSHPSLTATANLVTDLVASLENEGWITHTLLLSLMNTQRGQSTLPFRSSGPAGHGFDTLDKALVVWQDLEWPSKEADIALDSKMKNPNIHRRVDIIVSPWRTRGCAIAGWTSDTTFQRDLRRYARKAKGWKFDSSGVRDRVTGEVVPLEGPEGVDGSPEDAERKVFEGFGLEYREPWERCTG